MKKIFLLLIIFLVFGGCKTNTELIPFNFASVYNYKVNNLGVQIKVLNNSAENSSINIGIKTLNLIKNSKNNVRIGYEITAFRNLNLTRIQDSIKYYIEAQKKDLPNYFVKKFDLKLKPSKKYYLKITVSDLVKNTRTNYFKVFAKDTLWSWENFKITVLKQKKILLSPFVTDNQEIKIESPYLNCEKAKIFYFSQKFPLALPPFYMKQAQDIVLKADSIWDFSFSDKFIAYRKGIYHFRPNSKTLAGFVLTNFGDYYPKIQTSRQLSESFRYLMSKKEFEKIKQSQNLKSAVDSFWLEHSENRQKAATLVRNYYRRVQAANTYFTSITAGWRTDRGMIYIVLGEPSNVYKYKDREVWHYGTRIGFKTIEFIFWKIKNPISENYYILERSLKYKPVWYRAVETWRSGQIYKYRNK